MRLKEKQLRERIDAAVELYGETRSLRATARAMGCDAMQVSKLLITAGAYTTPAAELVKPWADSDLTDEQIAEKLGISRSVVTRNRPYRI